jgi:hypothetical protein
MATGLDVSANRDEQFRHVGLTVGTKWGLSHYAQERFEAVEPVLR